MTKYFIILPALLLFGAACTVSKPTLVPQRTPATTNLQPALSETDCGTAGVVLAPTRINYVDDATTSQAWQCFVDHFESCAPAKISAPLDTSDPTRRLEFKVVGLEGTACRISGPRLNELGPMTTGFCDISTRYLDTYFSQSAKNNPQLNHPYLKGYLVANFVMLGRGPSLNPIEGITCK